MEERWPEPKRLAAAARTCAAGYAGAVEGPSLVLFGVLPALEGLLPTFWGTYTSRGVLCVCVCARTHMYVCMSAPVTVHNPSQARA